MQEKQEIIIQYFREGKSQRQISRDLSLNRKTVRKVIKRYQELEEQKASVSSEDTRSCSALQSDIVSPPKYSTVNRGKRKLNEEVRGLLDEFIALNAKKRSEGLSKQVMRKIDMHEALQDKGIDIGYTTVCNYVSNQLLKSKEAYIRQVHPPGLSCEFDWAESKLMIGGKRQKVYMAVFTSNYSNYRYAMLFMRQDSLAFMESQIRFFAHIGGVYQEMIYDNMRVAVAQFVGKHERKPTKALEQLSAWYHFRYRFCNIGKGNEKGHVERSVEVIRRKAFSSKDTFDDLQQAQRHLQASCEKLNQRVGQGQSESAVQKLAHERTLLWVHPGEMECYQMQELHVDKYATCTYKTNHYSVPDHLIGKRVDVKIYAQKLVVYYDNKIIASHERSYELHRWYLKLEHYLQTLKRKPGALAGSLALQQVNQRVGKLYDAYFSSKPKAFIELLLYCQKHDIDIGKLEQQVALLLRLSPHDISVEKLLALLGNKPSSEQEVSTQGAIEIQSQAQLKEIADFIHLN